MNHHRNFLHWNIGFTRSWPVRCPASELPPADCERLHRWGQVVDGPRLTLRVEGKRVPLSFPNQPHEREVRQAFRQASPPMAFRIRLEKEAERTDSWAGVLELVQTSLPASLEGTLGIVFPEALWGSLPDTERQRVLGGIRGALTFECGGAPTLVVDAPLLSLESEREAQRLELVLDDRRRLAVRIDGVPGQQWLVVEAIQPAKGSVELHAGRLISLQREPVLTVSESTGPRSDLTALVLPAQELLRAWLQYEGLEYARDQDLFERRDQAPLEFNEVEIADSECFDVAIVNATAAEQWLGERGRMGGNLGIDVQVAAMAGNEPPRLASLERFLEHKAEGRLFARLRFDSDADRPPTLGRILVRENQGSASARKRRAKVLERLRSGKFASPRLLEHLLDPSRVQPVTAKLETFLRKNRKKSMEERQAEAVAKAAKLPALLLIQGPPGTGKTEVIVELVHELRARHGEREEGAGPFRVLIAGAHNDAVKNAFRRLDGMVVRVVTAEKQEQTSLEEQSARRGQDIASKARARIADSVTFQLIQAQRELRERLALARRALLDSGLEKARPRLAELVELGFERLLTGSYIQGLQALLVRLDALQRALECAPTQDGGSAAVSAALQRLPRAPLPEPGENPVALLALLGELEAAREAVLSRQEALSEELLLQADAWLSLKPRIEHVVNRGSGWSQALHARATELVRMQALPPESSPPTASTPTVYEEVLHSLEREGLLWCEEALRLISGQLTELMRREEVVLERWIRALEEDPRLFHELQSTYAPISAATCQKAADTLDAEDDFYDVVIVDEAARAGIDVLIPMALGRHVILVGDHRQLPPYVEEQIWRQLDSGLQERIDMGSSLFGWLRQRLPKENFIALDKQFRMHEDIGRLISKAFYEPEVVLRHHWEGPRAEERKLDLGLFGNQPTMWVDTKDRPDKESDCNEENGYEEEVIFKLLELIPREKLSALREKHGAVPIAVLAFYRRQRQRLEEHLQGKPSWLRDAVEISTVQSSQGREFPLVLIATTKSTRQRKIGFLQEHSSANVALSRAQSQVIILGDSETLAAEQHGRREPPWRKVFGLLQPQGSGLPSANVVLASEVLSWT